MTAPPPIVDAHLDMAMNVLMGRDYELTAAEVRAAEDPTRPKCMVTLRELERGGVAVAFATLFVGTTNYGDDGQGLYPELPEVSARRQLGVYRRWEDEGRVRIIRRRRDLDAHLEAWRGDGKVGLVLLVEGGDSIRTPDDLPWWFDAGVRVIGPAWSMTRYCGGTGRPGGLTHMGRDLVCGMWDLGILLDVSHMAEEAFWEAVALGEGPTVASHANARALVGDGRLVGADRHLSDDMIRAIGERDGVVGLVLFNGFLTPAWEASVVARLLHGALYGGAAAGPANSVTLDHVRAHAEHIASLVGWERVGIGSDLDGGLGADETPVELDTVADLRRVGEVAPLQARAGLLGGNWLRCLRKSLPP